MSKPQLPQELIDTILNLIPSSSDNPATFRICALVSHSFRPTSQLRLFRSIHVATKFHWHQACISARKLSAILADSPHLALYVQTLRLCSDILGWAEEAQSLLYILRLDNFPSLTTLEIFGLRTLARADWKSFPAVVRLAIRSLLGRDTISTLTLSHMRFATASDFLALASRNKPFALTLCNVLVVSNEAIALTPLAAHSLAFVDTTHLDFRWILLNTDMKVLMSLDITLSDVEGEFQLRNYVLRQTNTLQRLVLRRSSMYRDGPQPVMDFRTLRHLRTLELGFWIGPGDVDHATMAWATRFIRLAKASFIEKIILDIVFFNTMRMDDAVRDSVKALGTALKFVDEGSREYSFTVRARSRKGNSEAPGVAAGIRECFAGLKMRVTVEVLS